MAWIRRADNTINCDEPLAVPAQAEAPRPGEKIGGPPTVDDPADAAPAVKEPDPQASWFLALKREIHQQVIGDDGPRDDRHDGARRNCGARSAARPRPSAAAAPIS